MTERPPIFRYKARTAAALAVLITAMRRNPADTAAWDAHAREVREAQAELKQADPEMWAQLVRAGMDAVAMRSTPPMADPRTMEEGLLDNLLLG